MYCLHVQLRKTFPTTGFLKDSFEDYTSETLKPLILKCNRIIESTDSGICLFCYFYKLSFNFVTEILNNKFFNREKLESNELLLYFQTSGLGFDK